MKNLVKVLTVIVTLISGTTYALNCPKWATKDYVDQKNQALKNLLQSEIDNIPPPITYTAGDGITISNDHVISAPHEHKVGDFYQGGIIFWLDPTQKYQHGLIADIKDQSGTYKWDNTDFSNQITVGGTNYGVYSGKDNTAKIIASLSTRAEAAMACFNNTSGGYKDWYLPSSLELFTMINNQMTINQVAKANDGSDFLVAYAPYLSEYWSSDEHIKDNPTHYAILVTSDGLKAPTFKNYSLQVRCIRSF